MEEETEEEKNRMQKKNLEYSQVDTKGHINKSEFYRFLIDFISDLAPFLLVFLFLFLFKVHFQCAINNL